MTGRLPAGAKRPAVNATAPPYLARGVSDHAARLGEIGCPALVVGGREDGFFGPAEQAEQARALPRGRLVVYDRVGHSPHWEQPERFAADVAGFLAAPA